MKEIDGYISAVATSVVQQNSTTDEISRNLSNAADGARVIVTALSEVTNAVANSRQAAAEVLDVFKSVEAATGGLQDRVEGLLRRVAV